MKKANTFVKTHLNKIYLGIFVIFWVLILSACEIEPITPFEIPSAVDPTEIGGEWQVSKFYMLEEGFKLDLSAWVEYVNDSVFDIGSISFDSIAD